VTATIPGYLDASHAAEHLGLAVGTVYNLNSLDNDFPVPVYVGRTPLWSEKQLDEWRERHPERHR
jgi:predicted DNA-binding transcriptional regulator AlpA